MTEPVNLGKVSPSIVGAFAACPLRLVYLTDYPEESEARMREMAPVMDFGTVCHYMAQYCLGCAPPDEPTPEQVESARRCNGVPSTLDAFTRRVNKCAENAVKVLNQLSPLPPGVVWVSEHKAHDKSLLPTRTSRHGTQYKGFGGSIDIMRSDREILWDFKFVGRIPTEIKNEYLWQLGGYHIVSGVPKTGILWQGRDGTSVAHLLLDWREPHLQEIRQYILNFLAFVDLAHFRRYAWPVKGDSCGFCDYKHRCPLWRVPAPSDASISSLFPSAAEGDPLAHLTAAARQHRLASGETLI